MSILLVIAEVISPSKCEGGLPCGGPPSRAKGLADVGRDAVDRVHDVAVEKRERAEDGNGDHGQDDAVLRHRLPVLAVDPLEVVEELQQLVHLPSGGTSTPCGNPT